MSPSSFMIIRFAAPIPDIANDIPRLSSSRQNSKGDATITTALQNFMLPRTVEGE